MVERRGTLRLPVNGEEIGVRSAAHLKCPNCGEVVLRYQDSKRLGEDAIAIYRKKHGLLSADEIRAIREHFDLTQAELARLLRLGAVQGGMPQLGADHTSRRSRRPMAA
jgi:hypothetical protein